MPKILVSPNPNAQYKWEIISVIRSCVLHCGKQDKLRLKSDQEFSVMSSDINASSGNRALIISFISH